MASYYNISGELTQELLAAGGGVNTTSISLVNTHVSNHCHVDLYVEKKLKGKFYIMKNVELAIGTTLVYNNLTFNNKSGEFGLYIKLNKSASEIPTVDVIIS
tara:strand:+ start:1067 stop:1372 length:306 start_codon:yes stop_codon:yes gene_type:complete